MTLFLPPFLLLAGLLGVTATLAAADAPPATAPPTAPAAPTYPPLHLTWNVSTGENQVLGVFPHPLLAQRAVLTTATGLLLTDDAGRTWNALPEATTDKVGTIRDVAFHPLSPDTFYLASQTKGVWVTTDKGKTFSQLGTKANGMASDTVTSLIVYPGDSSRQTLLAVHGDAAAGLSRTRDGGKTWDVVNTEYQFRRVLGGTGNQPEFFLIGSTEKDPDTLCVYAGNTVGEFLAEVLHDVVPTDMVFAPTLRQKPAAIYLTTSDAGLYRIDKSDVTGLAYDAKKLEMKDVDGWASVGVTWGPSADVLNLVVYDPAKLGLVVSTDDLATFHTASEGLLVSSLVKEGAVIRPNANGTVFYAVINDSLSIGRESDDVPVVEFTPAAFDVNLHERIDWANLAGAFGMFANATGSTVEAARALGQSVGDLEGLSHRHQLTVTARLPLQPSPPVSVTLDLSLFGGSPETPLFDDGRHNDGAAGDGVYGDAFTFLPGYHRARSDGTGWGLPGHGRVAMGVTATYADGRRQTAVGVMDISAQVLDMNIWSEGVKSAASEVEGGVIAAPFLNPPAPNQPPQPVHLHQGDAAVRLTVPQGSWTVHFKVPGDRRDIDSQAAISFYLRLDSGEAPKELYLQLRDAPEFSAPTTTDRVPVLNGMTLNADYQQVVIPMSQLLGTASSFQADHLGEVILSGDTTAPATLVIDGLQALATSPPPNPPAPAK